MADETPRPHPPEPEPFRHDLHPDFLAGRNYGATGPHPEKLGLTLYDYKSAQRELRGLTDDELKQIPIMPEGSTLEQGATYIDLARENAAEFTATGEMVAGPDNLYVPKSDVNYVLWNRLTGVQMPERLDEASES